MNLENCLVLWLFTISAAIQASTVLSVTIFEPPICTSTTSTRLLFVDTLSAINPSSTDSVIDDPFTLPISSGTSYDVWNKFRKDNLGDATIVATRDTHREKNSKLYYWRIQGRFLTTPMNRPAPVTRSTEPNELTTFWKELRDRFRQSISEQITKIQNFKPLSATESVSSLYSRFKEPAQIVVEHKAMTTEKVMVILKKHFLEGVRELVDIWYIHQEIVPRRNCTRRHLLHQPR